jgi:hypothetical protein
MQMKQLIGVPSVSLACYQGLALLVLVRLTSFGDKT